MTNDPARALKRNLVHAAAVLVALHVVGTIGFSIIGHGRASVFDAFYMTFITVATIGYAETVDLSGNVWGRVFNVGIAITGIGTLWVIFSNFTALLLARTMDPARARARMLREVAKMQGHYIVCGLGRIGASVARELRATHREFVAVDGSQAAVDAFMQHDGGHDELRVLVADASDDDVLLQAGLRHAKGVFAVTGEDSKNMLIALSAKQLNPQVRVVARVHDVRNAEKCRRAGADEIVSPDFTGALRIASAMLRPQAAGLIDEMLRRSDAMRVIDVPLPASFAARPLGDLQLRASEYLVVGLHAGDGMSLNPGPETLLEPGAVLIALATPRGRAELERELALRT